MNDTFLKACKGEKVDYTPVWMMRQAGRYLPEYQAVRSKLTFLELCKTPELAAEVTIQPVDILGVDAAILFSDILIPLEAMGLTLEFHEKIGEGEQQVAQVALGVDRDRGYAVERGLFEQAHAQTGLSRPGPGPRGS